MSDRVELAVDNWKVGHDDHEVRFDKYRYVAFMLYIHPHTEVPSSGTLIHQVWQMGIKAPPPFAIWIQPEAGTGNWAAAPIELIFVLRNDATDPSKRYCSPERAGATYATPAEGTDCPIEMFRVQVGKGQWNRFVVQLKPSLGDGQLAVWQNRTPAPGVRPDAIYRGPWDCSAGMNQFDVRVGIYRRQQSRRLKLMFDNIRLGSTAASVH